MRTQFDDQLMQLNNELTEMGAHCENGIETIEHVLAGDDNFNIRTLEENNKNARQLRREIENLCIRLFLQQQPVAKDLRQISAALKMVTDLERITEQALDIGNVILYSTEHRLPEYEAINHMAEATIKMVKGSVEAYVKQDAELAEKTVDSDDIVDDAFDAIKKDLIHIIAEHPESGEPALDLLMIAKYLEVIGDHAVNIALWVKFALTGVLPEENI